MLSVLCHHNFRVKASANPVLKFSRILLTTVCTLQGHSIVYFFRFTIHNHLLNSFDAT